MYARITKALIETESCPERGQRIIRDLDLKGFGVRLTPHCKSYIVEGRVNGTQRRCTLGRLNELPLEQARKEAQKILADWKLGIDLVKLPPVPTLQEVMDRFLQERAMKPETKKTYRSLVERSLPDWLKLPVNALSKEMILNRHQQLVKPTRTGTNNQSCANAAMQVLRALMNYAAAKYDLAGLTNPTEALKYRWFRQEVRQGVIPDSKLRQFYEAVMKQPKIARDFILLLLFTGLRCFLQIKLGPARTRKWGQHANMQCISTSPVLVAKTHSKTGPVSEISGPQRFCPKLISQFLPAGAAATL